MQICSLHLYIYIIIHMFTSFWQNKIIKNPLSVTPLPVKVWNVGAFRKDGPGDQHWKFWDEVNPTWERYPYRGESWICWLFMNEVIAFHVVSKHVCGIFHLDPWRFCFCDFVPIGMRPPPRSRWRSKPCTTDTRQIGIAVNRKYNFVIFLHSPSAKRWCLRINFREVLGPSWFHVPFPRISPRFTLPDIADSSGVD